jgi:hypothetical protein
MQNENKKKVQRKKRSKVGGAKKVVRNPSSVPKELGPLASGFASNIRNGGQFLSPDYNIDLCHYFKPVPFRDGKISGSRVRGCAPIALISQGALSTAGSGCLSAFGVGGTLVEVLHLNPIYNFPTGSPENTYFLTFKKFRFRKLKLLYQTTLGTGSAFVNQIGYSPDGAIVDGDISTVTSLFSPGTMACVGWSPYKASVCDDLLAQEDWYYMDYDNSVSASDADYRQSFQGAVTGVIYSLASALPITTGMLWIEYEVDVVQPSFVQDLAGLSSKKDRPVVSERLLAVMKHARMARALAQEQKDLEAVYDASESIRLHIDQFAARQDPIKDPDVEIRAGREAAPKSAVSLLRERERQSAAYERSPSTDRKDKLSK